MFNGKTLMITGGTGSFGYAALKGFLHTGVKEIRIFSRDEEKQQEIRAELNNSKIKTFIGDIRFPDSVGSAMHGVDYVLHAAALKQVPSCEFHPLEAVRTNILGTENVLNAAQDCGVEKVIVLSTDKAVYPVNAMGISKAMMEKIMVAKARNARANTILCGARYGNIMASRGSVIPLFIKQVREGMPLTVTDPQMTRFLMSMEEALEMVLHAFATAGQGEIFVKKAPASTIMDLAVAVKELLQAKNSIKIIGTRHGEKLYETLLTREEQAGAEDHGGYFRVVSDGRDLNYGKYYSEGEERISLAKDYNSHNTRRLGVAEIMEKLAQLECFKKRAAVL